MMMVTVVICVLMVGTMKKIMTMWMLTMKHMHAYRCTHVAH